MYTDKDWIGSIPKESRMKYIHGNIFNQSEYRNRCIYTKKKKEKPEFALPGLHKQVFKIGKVCKENFAKLSELFTFATDVTGDTINLCFHNH